MPPERRSLTGKKWRLPSSVRLPDDVAASRSAEAVTDLLLRARGIEALADGELPETFGEDAGGFAGFARAADRIAHAMNKGEPIGIIGDYDCDGVTSTALLIRFFRRRGVQPIVRLPHRLREGYGVQPGMVDDMKNAGVTLLITVDTGISAGESVRRATAAGIDTIILDHHHLPPTLPEAYAIVHPSLSSGSNRAHPAAAGIAWSVVRGLEEREGKEEWEGYEEDIALAALGTIADVVELRDGNRTLAHRGLTALRRISSGPLAMLCLQAGLEPPYSSRDVAFRLAPRINAAGRMDDPHIALHALLGDHDCLRTLQDLNQQRRDIVAELLETLLPMAETEERPFLCFADERFSPGICGLLAARLCETYGKPALVAGHVNGHCTASLRSVAGYNVTQGLSRCSAHLTTFGGHAMAAGCSFAAEEREALHAKLCEDVGRHLDVTDLAPAMDADLELPARFVTDELSERLRMLEPFGAGNPEPRFLVANVTLERGRCAGKDGKHLQGTVLGKKIIGFGLGGLLGKLSQPVDLLCKIGIDTWQGRRNVQLFVEDIREAAAVLV